MSFMSAIQPFFAWVETTGVATTVGESMWLLASLSAVHVLGFTLTMGSALIANLRLMGMILPNRAVIDVTHPASVGIALGLAISITTGALLFSWRAMAVMANSLFQIKMLLLVAAAVLHFTLQRSVTRRRVANVPLQKATGAIGLMLWLGLALAGCAFILFE